MTEVHGPNIISIEGWLFRKTKILHRWQKEYFVLDNQGVLRYFKNLNSSKTGNGRKGDIVVRSHVSGVKLGHGASRSADCPPGLDMAVCGLLELVMWGGNNVVLCAQTLEGIRPWYDALEAALALPVNGTMPGVPSVIHVTRKPFGQKRQGISPSPVSLQTGLETDQFVTTQMAANGLVDAPPFEPECDIFEEGNEDEEKAKTTARKRSRSCSYCSENLIPVDEFTLDHLPEEYRDRENLRVVKGVCDRTVCIRLKYTSENRPDTYHPDSTAPYPYAKFKGKVKVKRTGTGFMIDNDIPEKVKWKKCPCPECRELGFLKKKYRYFKVWVRTAAHVVFDASEAEKVICDIFFDSPDSEEGVRYLYGVGGKPSYIEGDEGTVGRKRHDMFSILCVSHDMELYKMLKSTFKMNQFWYLHDLPVVVSHPHGFCKRISVGKALNVMIHLIDTHTLNSPYILPAKTDVKTQIDVMSEYPGFFRKHEYPGMNNWYETTQPLVITNIEIYDTWQYTKICLEGEDRLPIALPEDWKMTSVDGEVEFPAAAFRLEFSDLLKALKSDSHHYTHNIPTCSGSSGAYVATPTTLYPYYPSHFGKAGDGMNRTGDYNHTSFYL